MHASRLPRLLPFALAFLLSPPAFAADTPAAELLRQAEAERPAYLDTLRQLVAVDSGTGQAEGLGQLSALLAERLQALGAQVRSAPATPSAGDNLVATLDGTGSKRFLLMIHYDTVFAAGSAAKRPFREDAERAYGPGVADAKGGVAVVLHALALLRQQGFRDYGRITVLFNPDEETGSAGSKQLIAELARQQDYVFSYEPPDRDAVTVATNGIDGLLLEVKGRSSHAGSAPEQGRNAILELSHQLLRLKDLGDPAKGTTLNWTLARGGEKRNIIPAEASAEADMRYS
ncbi:glutamate carboxypeptidase, partial [Pseudomonas aeruginosa]